MSFISIRMLRTRISERDLVINREEELKEFPIQVREIAPLIKGSI